MKAVSQQYYRARKHRYLSLRSDLVTFGHTWQFPPRCGFSQKGRDGGGRTVTAKRFPRRPGPGWRAGRVPTPAAQQRARARRLARPA